MQPSVGWKNGQWLPTDQLHLSLDDWGVLQGAIIVDRLRTVAHHPLDLPRHLQRLADHCAEVGIRAEIDLLATTLETCAARNRHFFNDQDFSLVVLCTPGSSSDWNRGLRPTADDATAGTTLVYAQSLNWPALAHWYQHGQSLLVATHRSVPAACWSPRLKTRSRLNYYLADQEARDCGRAFAGGLLMNLNDELTETSIANLIVVDRAGHLSSPPADDVLNGISLERTLRLAVASGLKIQRRPVRWADLENASEVLLTGTSAGLWPVDYVRDAGHPVRQIVIDRPCERPVYQQLIQLWNKELRIDIVAQAIENCRSSAFAPRN